MIERVSCKISIHEHAGQSFCLKILSCGCSFKRCISPTLQWFPDWSSTERPLSCSWSTMMGKLCLNVVYMYMYIILLVLYTPHFCVKILQTLLMDNRWYLRTFIDVYSYLGHKLWWDLHVRVTELMVVEMQQGVIRVLVPLQFLPIVISGGCMCVCLEGVGNHIKAFVQSSSGCSLKTLVALYWGALHCKNNVL